MMGKKIFLYIDAEEMIERVPEAKDEIAGPYFHDKTGFGSEVDDEEFGEVCGGSGSTAPKRKICSAVEVIVTMMV